MSTNPSDDFIVAFGKNLKRIRAENGLRHQDMDDYGITRSYYGKIELGKHCTTLDKIEIPLDDGHKLVDTPGIIHSHQMAHVLSAKDLKIVAPQKEIKPRTYQLSPEQTIFIGGVARFDFEKGPRSGFVTYFENNLKLHRTKLANADHFYERHLGDLLTPPTADEVADFPPLEREEFRVNKKSDIVFEGLGWITVPAGVTVAAWVPKGVGALVRKAMI